MSNVKMMSDRQSKNNDKATKELLSGVSGRTRSKRDAYINTCAQARRIISMSQNVGSSNASYGSSGISSPINGKKRKTVVGQLSGYSSSSKQVDGASSGGISTPKDCERQKKKRRFTLKNPHGVGSNDFERHVKSKIGISSRQELNEGSSAASSRNNVVSHGSNQGPLFRKGTNTGNTICKGTRIKNTDEEFSTKKTYSKSPSVKTDVTVNGYYAATSTKNVGGVSKNKRGKSSAYVEKRNNNKCTSSREISHVTLKKGSSSGSGRNGRYSAATSRKNADVVVKEISFDSSRGSFSSDVDGTASDESRSYAETGSDDEDMFVEDLGIEKNDKNKKKLEVSTYSSMKRNNEDRNTTLNEDIKIHNISSYSSTRSDNDISTDDGISSYGANREINSGVASRTRSKKNIIKKASGLKNVTLDASDDSESLSSPCDSDGVEFLYSNDAQNNISIEVSSAKGDVHNRQEGNDLNHASKKTVFKSPNTDTNSSKQTKARKQRVISEEGHEENEETNKLLGDDDDFLKENADIYDHDKNETTDENDEIKQVFSEHDDYFYRMLADSVLGRGSVPKTKESDEEAKFKTQIPLPSKFGFEEEVSKKVNKLDGSKKEIEGLFSELEFCWALEELGYFNCPEVDQVTGVLPAEETPHARCASGKHELVWLDDQGLICIYCRHVELGPKDVLPEWAEKNYRESGRKWLLETDNPLECGEFRLKSSIANFTDSSNIGNGTVWSLKAGIRDSMYKHQQEGFEFLWKNLAGSIDLEELKKSTNPRQVGGCIISHAPGTGKTRLTIVFIETYMKLFPNCRPVIIAPAGMLLTWEEEFRKWNVEFPFLNLNNTDKFCKEFVKRRNVKTIRMMNLYSWNKGGRVLGVSYSLFEKLTGEKNDGTKDLSKILIDKPGLVVLDEGHTPRNRRSNIWNVLIKLRTEKRVILSGTPFQNNFSELFNTLRIVRPAIAGSLVHEKTFAESRRKHKVSKNSKSNFFSEIDGRAVENLKMYMSPFVHVHKGTILEQSLPGLSDCIVLLKPAPLQKSLIERFEGRASTFQFEHRSALLSVHPYLFRHVDSTEDERFGVDMAVLEASKLNPNQGVKTKFVLELVRLSLATNEKVVVFSQYIQPLELIKEQLKQIFKWVEGKHVLQMQGKSDQKQRQISINLFNDARSESRVMLASTKCCSEGISLVGASRVILLDVVWNPSVERQAISRAYRIGQKKFVYTYHLMTSGTTEADKYCRQAEKERLSELVFTSSSNEQMLRCPGFEDRILEAMVDHANSNEMFEKIINQPKDNNLIRTFGITS